MLGNTQLGRARAVGQFLWIIYGVMVFATALCWVVLGMLTSQKEESPDAILVYLLGGLALIDTGIVLFVRYVRLPPLLGSGRMTTTPDPHQHTLRLGKLRGHYIFCYVIIEAVALFGFVLGLMAGDANLSIPFFAAAGVLFILCYPRVPPDPLTGPTG